jgi:RNA polymerase sigma-70 factor, ECF subfamily
VRCLMEAWHDNEPQIKSWLIKQTGHQDKAQDLLQDLFIKAMQHKDIFCTTEDAKSWLFKVAKNTLIDYYRKTKFPVDILPDNIEEKSIEENADSLTDLQHCLLRVLLELDETDKDIIEQCDMQGLHQADYAQLNQLSLSATKSRLLRARKKLREQMVTACKVKFEENKVCCFTPRK